MPNTRPNTWAALITRFAEFKSMPCLRASGPDHSRPKKELIVKQITRQFESLRQHLPARPTEVQTAHLAAVLRARGLAGRGEGRRPSQTAFWNGLWRAIILDRDDYRCCFCQRSAVAGVDVPGEGRLALRMELDHATPRAAGGVDYCLQNIRAICRTCNTARSRMSDEHFRAELTSLARAVLKNR